MTTTLRVEEVTGGGGEIKERLYSTCFVPRIDRTERWRSGSSHGLCTKIHLLKEGRSRLAVFKGGGERNKKIFQSLLFSVICISMSTDPKNNVNNDKQNRIPCAINLLHGCNKYIFYTQKRHGS